MFCPAGLSLCSLGRSMANNFIFLLITPFQSGKRERFSNQTVSTIYEQSIYGLVFHFRNIHAIIFHNEQTRIINWTLRMYFSGKLFVINNCQWCPFDLLRSRLISRSEDHQVFPVRRDLLQFLELSYTQKRKGKDKLDSPGAS